MRETFKVRLYLKKTQFSIKYTDKPAQQCKKIPFKICIYSKIEKQRILIFLFNNPSITPYLEQRLEVL